MQKGQPRAAAVMAGYPHANVGGGPPPPGAGGGGGGGGGGQLSGPVFRRQRLPPPPPCILACCRYGLSTAALASLFAADQDLALVGTQSLKPILVYTCTGLGHRHEGADDRLAADVVQTAAAAAAAAAGSLVRPAGVVPSGTNLQDPPVDASSVFKLHSRVGSR
jgi:hypothetical protein